MNKPAQIDQTFKMCMPSSLSKLFGVILCLVISIALFTFTLLYAFAVLDPKRVHACRAETEIPSKLEDIQESIIVKYGGKHTIKWHGYIAIPNTSSSLNPEENRYMNLKLIDIRVEQVEKTLRLVILDFECANLIMQIPLNDSNKIYKPSILVFRPTLLGQHLTLVDVNCRVNEFCSSTSPELQINNFTYLYHQM